MYQTQKKVILHEFSMYKNGRRVSDSFHPAFLKQIFDHRSDEYYDWCFASNTSDIDLDHIIVRYRFRWRVLRPFSEYGMSAESRRRARISAFDTFYSHTSNLLNQYGIFSIMRR